MYDEFNNGIRHPVAVRRMMTWAAAKWTAPAPAYLVLMGDGHSNLKGFTAAIPQYAAAPNPFPPYLILKTRGWARSQQTVCTAISPAMTCRTWR